MPKAESNPPLLVFADDWGRHPSSCQHLIRRLQNRFTIVWANSIGTRRPRANLFTLRRGFEKVKSWSNGLQKVGDCIWTVDLPMLPTNGRFVSQTINRCLVMRRLTNVLERLSLTSPIILTTLPHIYQLIHALPRRGLVYYCTDDYRYWHDSDRNSVQEAELELCQKTDLILAVSRALQQRLEGSTPCRYFPHGVDAAHFSRAQTITSLPAQLEAIRGPRIGFFGLIYEKLDFSLLCAIANRNLNASLIMIGPIAYCPDEFSRLPNVHMVGSQPYQNLPEWISGLDVLLMPYVDDPMIRQSCPLKLRECLATGKPTVSVDVAESRSLEPHVFVASTHDGFLQHVDTALRESTIADAVAKRQEAVSSDDWGNRADELAHCLNDLAHAPAL